MQWKMHAAAAVCWKRLFSILTHTLVHARCLAIWLSGWYAKLARRRRWRIRNIVATHTHTHTLPHCWFIFLIPTTTGVQHLFFICLQNNSEIMLAVVCMCACVSAAVLAACWEFVAKLVNKCYTYACACMCCSNVSVCLKQIAAN